MRPWRWRSSDPPCSTAAPGSRSGRDWSLPPVPGRSSPNPRLPPSEHEVRDWQDPGGADDRHRGGPQPLGASDLGCRTTLEVDERGDLEDPFGRGRRGEEPAVALAEIAPLFPSGHGLLRLEEGDRRDLNPRPSGPQPDALTN